MTIDLKLKNDLFFKAEMTNRQFLSLKEKIMDVDICSELSKIDFFNSDIKSGKCVNIGNLSNLLLNSWNTESLLHCNREFLKKIENSSVLLQWVFPQVYYCMFNSLVAHFHCLGYTQSSHKAVIKEFGNLVELGKIPKPFNFFASGGKGEIKYFNIQKPLNATNSMNFGEINSDTCDNHICQLLKSTREISLDKKKDDLKLKNKRGKPLKRVSKECWDDISRRIGNTTLLDFIYRKRIKANYKSIDTFLSPYFKISNVLESLIVIVQKFNLINEAYICKTLGKNSYSEILSKFHNSEFSNNYGPYFRFEKNLNHLIKIDK